MSTVILAHGLFGFGDILPSPLVHIRPHYFNEVASHLTDDLHLNVFEPQTNPVGSIEQRAGELAEEITRSNLSDPLYIIAHSMGGLDARFLITHLREVGSRVATLVTIGTPHAGSPVADAFVNPLDPLRADIPPLLLKLLDRDLGALRNLTTDSCRQFNQETPDVDGVRYLEIAGTAPKDGSELLLLNLAAKIGKIHGDNDGVVTVESAVRPNRERFAVWPVDHLGEIGWSTATIDVLRPQRRREAVNEHLKRYDAIITAITAKAAGAGS